MSRIGPDGLRSSERDLLELARAGATLPPQTVVQIIERLGRHRLANHEQRSDTQELARLRALNEHLTIQRDADVAKRKAANQLLHAARHDLNNLTKELHRVKTERDDFRLAARDADGQRLAMARRLGSGGTAQAA